MKRQVPSPASSDPSSVAEGRRPWLVAIVLLLAAIGPYLNSLEGSFHFDDEWDIVHKDTIRSWDSLAKHPPARWPAFFLHFVNYKLFGLDGLPGWHATNILLHATCVLMLWATLRLLLAGRADCGMPAFLAALLFAVHPLASEPVNYIRARWVMLYTAFSLLALQAMIRAHRAGAGKTRAAWLSVMAVSVVLAGLAKEVGWLYAAGLCALYAAVFIAPRYARSRRFWLIAGGAVVALPVSGAAALWAMGSLPLMRRFASHPLLGHHAWGMMTVFWRYVSLAVWPAPGRLSVDHYVPYYPARVYAAGDADVLAGMAGIALWLAATVWVARKRPAAGLLLAVPVLGLMPYFFVPSIDILIEYKAYFPLVGFCGLGGMAAAWVCGRFRTAGTVGVAALVVAMAIGVLCRNPAWRTERTLWEDAAGKGPRKARTVNALAWILATEGTPADRERALELALRSFDPRYVDPWWGYDPHLLDTLAEAYYVNGHYDRAIEIETEIIERRIGKLPHFRAQLAKFRAAAGEDP